MSERNAIAPSRQGASTGAVAGIVTIVGNALGLSAETLVAFVAAVTGVTSAVGNLSRDKVHKAEAAGNEPSVVYDILSYF